MVNVEVSYKTLKKQVGKEFSLKELEEMLFNLGFELEGAQEDMLVIGITAERPDLLSSFGLARMIRSYLGLKNPVLKIEKAKEKVKVQSPAKEWPFAVACIVKGLKFDDEKIKEIIRVQEKIGSTFLRKRKKGGLGVYPLDKIKFPVIFTSQDPKEIVFQPLESSKKMNGLQILETHPTGQKYKDILQGWKRFPVFRDSNKDVLSMPPIVNSSDLGRVDESTKDVFVEVTGTDLKTINLALEVLVSGLIGMGGKAYSLEIDYGDKKILSPSFKEEERKIEVEKINKLLGTTFSPKEVSVFLEKMGYAVKSASKKDVNFLVPATRSDIWHDVDIIDDVARAFGFNKLELRVKPVNTVADTTKDVKVKEKVSQLLVGLGYQEVFTLMLTSSEDQFKRMNLKEEEVVRLGATVEQSINMVRSWLLPEVMKCLKENRSIPYPQNLFEINYVTIPEKNEVKSKDVLKLSLVSAHNSAGFTQVKQVLEFLFSRLDLQAEFKAIEHDSFIEGRVAQVSVGNKKVGLVGEIHPKVLENWGLELPVAALELDLTSIFDL